MGTSQARLALRPFAGAYARRILRFLSFDFRNLKTVRQS